MEEITQHQNQAQRPQLLTALTILSFIGSGASFLSYFLMSIYYNAFLAVIKTDLGEVYSQMGLDVNPEMLAEIFEKAGRPFFLLMLLAYTGSLWGVYKMWNLQKEGLHYYAISQLVILILPLIFISTQMSVLPGLLLTILFILLYFRSFKMMEDGK
ncbi:MAG: hypothetical protein J7J72_10430 [Bacteroidales bacterium]|nr:hypothetical protein [Bacteroidales bacterium]